MNIQGMMQQLMNMHNTGALQNDPTMELFQQMMRGKNQQQQIQTLLNLAQSKGFDIHDKSMFQEADLRKLGLLK